MAELSIKVSIANRVYPLKVKQEEEEGVRKAAKLINDRIKEYESNYSVRDKQDLLAMCVLQFANESLARKEVKPDADSNEALEGTVEEIDRLLSDCLEKK